TTNSNAPRLAIFSAFPAELAPMVNAAHVTETVTVDGRKYYLGTLEGVRVILGLLGIGMENATNRSTSVLDHFSIAGVIVGGVAGGYAPERVGAVPVPAAWVLAAGGGPYPTNPALYALAGLAAGTPPAFEQCPVKPNDPSLCLTYVPAVLLGGL